MMKIDSNLVNPRSLSETVRNDETTAMWMRYVCLSKNVRTALEKTSAKACGLYAQNSRYAWCATLTLLAAIINAGLWFFQHSLPILGAGIACFAAFIWFEQRQRKIFMELSKELLLTLQAEQPEHGTLFQFGENVARKYNVSSFIDFNGSLDHLLQRAFVFICLVSIIIYTHTSWMTLLWIAIASLFWQIPLKPLRILSFILRLK